jgi:tRNA threonylcarbamoyl adenosine modification protein (Sua5/YciO/YrdC/YwlC family)
MRTTMSMALSEDERACYGPGFVARARVTLLEVNSEFPEPHRIRQAIARLESGKVIIYPTDTMYGLAADMAQHAAVERLYALRRLDPKKPLSLICASLAQMRQYAAYSNECFRFMKRVLPGPYTFILSATREAPRMGQSKRRTVGVRMPAHPVAQALVEALGRPLLSTSAMPDGENAFSDPVSLADQYGASGEVALVLDAGILGGTPSTVIDWSEEQPVVIRRGAGPVDDLE